MRLTLGDYLYFNHELNNLPDSLTYLSTGRQFSYSCGGVTNYLKEIQFGNLPNNLKEIRFFNCKKKPPKIKIKNNTANISTNKKVNILYHKKENMLPYYATNPRCEFCGHCVHLSDYLCTNLKHNMCQHLVN
jgi:hypothetical protein